MNIPLDWTVNIVPQAGSTKIEMWAVHGAGFLDDLKPFDKFLKLERLDAENTAPVTAKISTYMTGSEDERVIQLNKHQIRLEKSEN